MTYDAELRALTNRAEQAVSRRNKDGKKHVKYSIPGENNKDIWVRDKTKVTYVVRQDCTWAGLSRRIADGQSVSPHGHFTKRDDLVEDRRDNGETNYTSNGRQIWKQHAGDLRPTTGHYSCMCNDDNNDFI